ncbi:MAG: HD domain-containing phosphohydrolase [Candidatus Omnitrophota bacterium]|nr:HD domain-containing phosphohydrolase [Candidatus Omnitrophota bacterium]
MKMNIKLKLASIENASLIRKFTVLFIVMSLLPFLVIAYLFTQYTSSSTITMDQNTLMRLLFLTGFGALAGFWGIRKSIIKIQEVTRQTKEALSKNMPDLAKIETEENEVTQLARTFNEVTKNLEDNIKRLEASKQTIQYVLSKIALGVSSQHTIDTFLELIVEITAKALEAKTGVLMLLDEKNEELYVKVASGFKDTVKNLRIKVGEEGPGWVAKYKKPLLIPQLHKLKPEEENDPFVPPLLSVPLTYQDKLVGVLAVSGKLGGGNFGEDELLILSNLASQTAIAVENERLHQDAEGTYLETISALAIAVEARDHYSRGHLDRVSQYAVRTAQKLGLDEQIIKDIKDAAELHDIGKIGISDDILKKESALTEDEARIMNKHPIIGEAIIKPVRRLSSLCDIVRHHHEWLDGTGYPDRLEGGEISIGAKILCVVDAFDAMTTNRPYRKALSIEEAKRELKNYAGIRYDVKVVEAFLSTR